MDTIDTQDYLPRTIVDEDYLILSDNNTTKIRFMLIVEEDLVDKIDFRLEIG